MTVFGADSGSLHRANLQLVHGAMTATDVPQPLQRVHGAMTAAVTAAEHAANAALAVAETATNLVEAGVQLDDHAAAAAGAVAAVPRGPAHQTVMTAVLAARNLGLAAKEAARLVPAATAPAEAAAAAAKAACDNLVEAWVQLDAYAGAATVIARAEAAAAAATKAEAAFQKILDGMEQLEQCIF